MNFNSPSIWRQDRNKSWNPTVLLADRCLAVVGCFVFGMLYSCGIVIFPLWFFNCFVTSSTINLAANAAVSFTLVQLINSFGRQGYFYGSVGYTMLALSCLSFILIALCALSLFLLSYHFWISMAILAFQIAEVVITVQTS